MTASNHVLAGSIIGAFLPLPLAIPVAFLSHFLLDMVPHFGDKQAAHNNSKTYKRIVYADTLIGFLLAFMMVWHQQWQMLLCGIIAFSPDLTHVVYYLTHNRSMDIKPTNKFIEWHSFKIQREYKWGVYVELAFFAVLLPVFASQLYN